MSAWLDDQQVRQYQDFGIVCVDLPTAAQRLQEQFLDELSRYLSFWHSIDLGPGRVHEGIMDLALKDRAAVGRLYKVSRRFPSVKAMAASEWAVGVAAQLMNTALVSCCNFLATRLDLPDEDEFATLPHQDFPYIQGSLDGVTIWVPMQDVPLEMGPPQWLPSSHLDGPAMIQELGRAAARSGSATILAVDEATWRESQFQSMPVPRASALVFSTLLVHRSGLNRTDRPRVSAQLRFDNLESEGSYTREFPEGLYLGDVLSASYPELVSQT